MNDSLSITSRDSAKQGCRVLKLSGKLSLDSVPNFLKAMRAESARVVILDLADMGYLDSSGVGAMVQQFSAMKKENRHMVLVHPHERVVAVLQITKVLSLFQRANSVEDAEAQIQ